MSEAINRMDSPQSQQQEIITYSNANNQMTTSESRDQTNRLKERLEDFRAWLFFLTTLVATISYTAGLTPPGGFWSTDDKEKGYVAGTSVMRAMFPRRYVAFSYCNATAFFSSLMIIGLLGIQMSARTIVLQPIFKVQLRVLVGICFVSVGISFISGTWESTPQGSYGVLLFVIVLLYFLSLAFIYLYRKSSG